MDRPHFKRKNEELRDLVFANPDDRDLSDQVLHELGFRKSRSAKRLKAEIAALRPAPTETTGESSLEQLLNEVLIERAAELILGDKGAR